MDKTVRLRWRERRNEKFTTRTRNLFDMSFTYRYFLKYIYIYVRQAVVLIFVVISLCFFIFFFFLRRRFHPSPPPPQSDIKTYDFSPTSQYTPGALTIYYNVRRYVNGACLHAESGCVSDVGCRTDSPTNAVASERTQNFE